MSQFFGQQTLTAQYFRPQYLHGASGTPPIADARSGYWRLFFTKMQEEALKQYEKHVEPSPEVAEKQAPPKKVKLPPLVELEVYEVPDFKRKPIYTQETKIEAQLPAVVAQGSDVLNSLYKDFAKYIIAWKQQELQQELQQVEAANDADARIRLLLLAA